MEIVKITANALFPLFCYMGIGFLLGRLKIITMETAHGMNLLVFRLLLPFSTLINIWTAELSGAFDAKVIFSIVGLLTFIFITGNFAAKKTTKDKTVIPVMIQGSFKANFTLLSLPVLASIYGKNMGVIAVALPIVVILQNIFSVYAFERYTGKSKSLSGIFIALIKNPLIISCTVGLLLNFTNPPVPPIVKDSVIKKLGDCATPIGLLALGATFRFDGIVKYRRELGVTLFIKMILFPLIAIPFAELIGIRGSGLSVIGVLASAPIAINSYSTAVAMGGNEELANIIVVASSVLSMLTMFLAFCAIGFTVGLF
ncbi:MAG: AEC family transporter [Sphaerochaetaceae bacterium]|nr:AEC family transporter [Sphaerochaetaceae bacterium]